MNALASSFPALLASCHAVLVMRIQLRLCLWRAAASGLQLHRLQHAQLGFATQERKKALEQVHSSFFSFRRHHVIVTFSASTVCVWMAS